MVWTGLRINHPTLTDLTPFVSTREVAMSSSENNHPRVISWRENTNTRVFNPSGKTLDNKNILNSLVWLFSLRVIIFVFSHTSCYWRECNLYLFIQRFIWSKKVLFLLSGLALFLKIEASCNKLLHFSLYIHSFKIFMKFIADL